MKKFLFAALLAFLFSLPAHSQTIAGTLTVQGSTLNCSSLTGRNTSAISIAVNNSQTNVAFVLSGTWVGTVTFYGTTNNGIQWWALSVTPTGGGSPVTSSTTNGSWGASVSTNTNFCAVSTAFTSGQIFANAMLTTTGGGGSGTVTTSGMPAAGVLAGFSGATAIGPIGTTPWMFDASTSNSLDCLGSAECAVDGFENSDFSGKFFALQPNLIQLSDGTTAFSVTVDTTKLLLGSVFTVDNSGNIGTANVKSTTSSSATNCAANGSAANPSVAACGSASAGMFSCATAATGGSCTVNTSAVTANSEVTITPNAADGGASQLNVTCNTGNVLSATAPVLKAKVDATSFTINLGTVSVNPACFEYTIKN